MKKSKLKNYDWFLPEERFQLTLAALTRDDELEIEKLFASCPRKTYTQIDTDYTSKIKALKQVIIYLLFLINDICRNAGVFSLLAHSFSEMMSMFEEGFNLACQANNEKQIDKSLTRQKKETIKEYLEYYNFSEEKMHENIIKLKSAFQAFILFCEEIGINHSSIIEWLGNYELFMQSYCMLDQDVDIETLFVELEKNNMLQMWNKITQTN
jgi:hypothetical protein